VFTSPLSSLETDANDHIAKHGDGVKEVAFIVDDAAVMM
jgi:4-hydroxyphenylpyruvate dioxygenase-like putative hemolysin